MIKEMNDGKKLLCVGISLLFSMIVAAGNSLAAEYVSIEIFPQHVGVFTTDGTQQFVAYGVDANGGRTNITPDVEWISSNEYLVTINENGLATIVNDFDPASDHKVQVKITASYPKSGNTMSAVNLLLKQEVYTVTATASGDGNGTVASDIGGISYSYPTADTGTSSTILAGNSVVVTVTAGTDTTVAWDDCAANGGVEGGDTAAATCTFSSLNATVSINATFTSTAL